MPSFVTSDGVTLHYTDSGPAANTPAADSPAAVVLVAGFLAAAATWLPQVDALRAAGHRAARYTSPHLVDLTERFVIDGRPVDRAHLRASVSEVRNVVEHLRSSGTLEVQPTFFEATTAVAFALFRQAGVDIAVCEVGLGGRLDATNVLQPVAAAITSIGFDHQQYLGGTLGEIAREKAGIIKPGVPVVVGRMDPAARAVIGEVAEVQHAPLVDACDGVDLVRLDIFRLKPDATVTRIPTRVRLRTFTRDYGQIALALAGDHQIDNAVIAVRLLEVLDTRQVSVPGSAIAQGLKQVSWPARLDLRRLPDGREALLDAAHNPDGAAALAAFLTSKPRMKRPLVFAAMRDKDAAGMLRLLMPAVGTVILTRASNARSADPGDLAAYARQIAPDAPVEVHPALSDALAAGWNESTRIVVAGSIFLVGDVMKEFGWS